MASFPTAVFAIILLFYLCTFILCAIIRFATGISIQRLGWFSIRRVVWTPKDGYQVAARTLGLSIHWPSFARPTIVTIQLKGLVLSVDPNVSKPRSRSRTKGEKGVSAPPEVAEALDYPDSQSETDSIVSGHGPRSKTWERLKIVKERMKWVHKKIHLFTLVDVEASDVTIRYVGAGDVNIGSVTLGVDTRRDAIEKGNLFRHKKEAHGDQQPVEWSLNMRNVFLALDGRDGIEILDNFGVNVHGLLKTKVDGLRDVSIAVKAGKFHVPYDDLMTFAQKAKEIQMRTRKDRAHDKQDPELSFAALVEELDRPGSREESIVQKAADFRELASSLLRGIQEMQLAISFFRVSRMIQPAISSKKPLYLNVVTHEVGIDVHRMDQTRPAHRMYFRRDDVAHQALLALVSLSVSLGEDTSDYGKIMYIPMATTTIKTTLPSKTVAYSENRDAAERNTNILFANFVVTSPSVDLEPRQFSNILNLLQGKRPAPRSKKRDNHLLISRLLPKASIKLSVHEPVLRFVLPRSRKEDQHDFDMLVSSISSLSLDIESSHSAEAGVQYSLAAVYRVASHQLYYQTLDVKHRLLATEKMEVKLHLTATNEVCVIGTGTLNTFSLHLVSAEVTRGVHQVVEQFYNHAEPTKLASTREPDRRSILRRIPPWLLHFHFETHGFSLEIAGVDENIGPNTRGMVIQLQSWTVDYQAQRPEPRQRYARRRTPSHSAISEDPSFRFASSSPSRRPYRGPADGRRLALHGRNLEGFVMESADFMEQESFLSVPRLEVALTTSSDLQGPVFHINSLIQEIFFKHSLYRYYAIGIAVCALHDAFAHKPPKKVAPDAPPYSPISTMSESPMSPSTRPEIVAIDVKTHLIQVKCEMPLEPPMLLQIYGLVAGRHRWSSPFLRCALVRLHAEAPKKKRAWSRIVTVNNVRAGLRENYHMPAESIRNAKCIDISTDFIRLGVPHQMIMHRIFDNFVNTTKAIQQLNHRFKTRSNDYVLDKHPEGPKKVPRISLRTKALLFELEDDAFEWKLGSIFRLGLLEQKQRLAREEAHMMKIKKIDECRRRNSRQRAQSRRPVTRNGKKTRKSDDDESGSPPGTARAHFKSPPRGRLNGCSFRYNAEKAKDFSGECGVTREQAWYRMQQLNARSWKEKITNSIRAQNTAIKEIRALFLGADEPPDGKEVDENILSIPNRPGLLSVLISDLHLTLDKPSFPVKEYADFLHKIGKGMPKDMKYSLLIPMSIRLNMGEARAHLRDYPLDLIHIPALRPGQSHKLPSWSLSTDFVIAEEYRNVESSRHVVVNIVPPTVGTDGVLHPGFSIDVRRTVSPVKMYSNPIIEVHTSLPTTLSWGMSYQPVIQDMMKIIEGFTKPEIDPSERVGFWDKIRLSFHSRLNIVWKGDGDVHLRLKGSRDPYVVTGYGAGFVMCWRRDVQWEIRTTDDPKEFMKVSSGEYVLAVPDYSHQARHTYESSNLDSYSSSSNTSSRDSAMFKKVVMKLSGNVRWLAGLVFERNLPQGHRSFKFKPHYDVVLKNPKFVDLEKQPDYDAFHGFRSNHIHLSLAVEAPGSRMWTYSNKTPSTNYNTVHLTPRFFTHFFNWWSLFSGMMSLPVRQGKLFPGITKTSKKFSRHLGTVKYNLFLSPLFVSHIYKHKDPEDYSEDVVVSTGLKVRLESFMLDLHQRREQVLTVVRGRSQQTKASTMQINRAQLDFISADCRAVSASIGGTNPEDLQKNDDDIVSSFQQPVASVDLSRFTIPDQDFNWIDMDDFVELDWILPSESNPKTQILPLAYSPRFSYFRQTDYEEVGPDEPGYSPFGDEPTHHCVMSASQDNDPRRVQMELIRERLETLGAQIESHRRIIGEHELHCIRDADADEASRSQYELLLRQGETLEKRKAFLESGLRRLEKLLAENDWLDSSSRGRTSDNSSSKSGSFTESQYDNVDAEIDGLYASSNDEFINDFNNRFIIHNLQGKWNNSLRNIILRYIHQVSQRRGFVYYMSRRAVKFILDIVEEQAKNQMHGQRNSMSSIYSEGMGESDDDEASVQDRIEQLLNDAKQFVHADEAETRPSGESGTRRLSRGPEIAPEFTAQNSYHLRLIGPQIQFQSEKNKKSVALLAAKSMQLKVVSIMDKNRTRDDISGLVQRQFTLDMDCAQFFIAQHKIFSSHPHVYGGNRYGNAPGVAWPPWVSLESIFDFQLDTFGFSRIIQKTSASLRYDKYNSLRLKYNEKVASDSSEQPHSQDANENRIDSISVEFPHVRAICDSAQYYAMYIIVLDLLLYSEPLEKVRSEKLEKLMLASDFSDLRGAPEMVSRLQQRIRHLEEIKNMFQIQAKYLDKQGWEDRMILERDLTTCEDELFFIMKAITTSQRKNEERAKSQSSGLLRWTLSASEIVWHLMKDFNEPLVEFQLRDASYERTDNIDGSNNNTIEVRRISGLNLLPSAVYPQMIVPYLDHKTAPQSPTDNMLRVDWYMLEAISGIPVLNQFEVTLFPLKVQLERELGKRLFEYIFPGVGSNAFENGGFSPFIIKQSLDEDDADDDDDSDKRSSAAPSEENGSATILESRLHPTLSLPDKRRSDGSSKKGVDLAMTPMERDSARSLFRYKGDNRSRSESRRPPTKKKSTDSLRFIGRRETDKSSLNSQTTGDTESEEKPRRFVLTRSKTVKPDKPSDDISQMMSRASNYMILTNVKINDVVLCLSYKGKGNHNIEDLHNFVFRLPVLEYRNKAWSNLDLALRLKKDAIKALISHAPAILSNKFSHQRPSKQQQKRLRELATSSQVLSVADNLHNWYPSGTLSDAASSNGSRSSMERSESPRRSFNSAASPMSLSRPRSAASSMQSSALSGTSIAPDSRSVDERNGYDEYSAAALTRSGTHDPSDTLRPRTADSTTTERQRRRFPNFGRRFLNVRD